MPLTPTEVDGLNKVCNLIEEAQSTLAALGDVPHRIKLRDALNDARNKVNRVLEGQPLD